ncbi:MAG: thiamine phosphate synthase [Acidobacteria bacterium]|nr:thiamine phosphate synthase [Acidobacteriota bacterium]
MGPVICMITDRRRPGGDWESGLVERIAAAARAGVHLIQIRERDLDARALARLVERGVAAVRGTGARILVNDRVDVALAAGAHGVHLRGDSMAASRVRAVVPPAFVIGRSVHARGEAERVTADGGLDYLVYGTVFESGSKPEACPAGLAALAEVTAATALPVLAVGGVTAERAAEVAWGGAAGIAAIGLFAGCPIGGLQVVVRQATLAFDTPGRVS